MSRLENRCEDLVCFDCPFKNTTILCNLAHKSDASLNEVLEEVKKDVDKVEKRLSSKVEKKDE